jgi:hypothetical protein
MEFRSLEEQTAVTQALQGGVRRGNYSAAEEAFLAMAGYNTDGTRNGWGDFRQGLASVDIGTFGLIDNTIEHQVQGFLRGDEGDAMRSQGYEDLQARDRELQAQQYMNSFQIMQQIWGMAGGSGAGGGAGAVAGGMMGDTASGGAGPEQWSGPTTAELAKDFGKDNPELKTQAGAEAATSAFLKNTEGGQKAGSAALSATNTDKEVVEAASKGDKSSTGSDISAWGGQMGSLAGSITSAVGNAVQQNELSVEKDDYISTYISRLNRSLKLNQGEYVL